MTQNIGYIDIFGFLMYFITASKVFIDVIVIP